MRHLTKHTFFQIFWHIWQYTYGSVIIFWVFFPCIKYRSYIFLFESCWKRGFIYCIFKLDKWKSPKMSEFSLIIMEKIFWFLRWFSLCISSNIYSFPTCENEKENLCDFLGTSPMVSMLGWFLYLTMVFQIGSLVLFAIGSLSAYSGI